MGQPLQRVLQAGIERWFAGGGGIVDRLAVNLSGARSSRRIGAALIFSDELHLGQALNVGDSPQISKFMM